MASYFISKDKRFRHLNASGELLKMRARFFLLNSQCDFADKQKINFLFFCKIRGIARYSVKSKNRCVLTSRSGSVFRYFRVSRILLKNFASCGFLAGVKKSSW